MKDLDIFKGCDRVVGEVLKFSDNERVGLRSLYLKDFVVNFRGREDRCFVNKELDIY